MDCMDCKSTTDINLSVEYYSNNNGTMGLDSTTNFSYSGPGLINTTLPLNITSSNDLIPYLSPVNIREYCGDELKNVNNSTVNLQSTIGDSISGIYKYNWSENWDCK
tara:strand:- start:347 stop:667 length:321 start_codon:yes stop_codon:yes gene_type:complete